MKVVLKSTHSQVMHTFRILLQDVGFYNFSDIVWQIVQYVYMGIWVLSCILFREIMQNSAKIFLSEKKSKIVVCVCRDKVDKQERLYISTWDKSQLLYMLGCYFSMSVSVV